MTGSVSRIGLISDPITGPSAGSVPLDAVGIVSGIQYSTQYPGGDLALSFALSLDPSAIPSALRLGRRLRAVLCGQNIWQGTYDSPDPGTPWQISATGQAGLAANVTVATGFSSNVNVDAKISSGEIPWTRIGSLPDGPQPATQTQWTLTDFLNNAALSGTKWIVSANGEISGATDPTTPSYVLIARERPARSTQTYYTRLYGAYLNSGASGALAFTNVNNAAAEAAHGIRSTPVDLTEFGPISTAQAQGYLQTVLNRCGYRASFTGPFIATTGQLLSWPGGVPVDLAVVRAGCMVRVINLDADQGGEISPTGFVDVVIGETDYTVDDDTLELHPIEISREDLQQLLTDLKQAA